ncbi:hypothetical protein HYX00_05490 [Candidatus Woesearchaeota archaeon]|nr:hypothetical protein [Candidatus Woesearchaeota archaeon]
MNKKAQIQIGETIAVLFVFFILIVIGFIFYAKVMKGSIESEKEEFSQLKSIAIAQRVMFLPELQCSEDNIIRDNCIDVLKLGSAQSVMGTNQLYYYDLFGISDVNVAQIYPSQQRWSIYSRKKNYLEAQGIRDAPQFVTNVPISLYNPTAKRFGFGILTIETLSK